MTSSRALLLGFFCSLLTAAGLPAPAAADAPVELLSRSLYGEQGNAASSQPAISADGRFVAFTSDADNLVDGDSGSSYWGTDPDVFILDRETGMVENASRALNSAGYWFLKTVCQAPTLDASGQLAAFECFSGYHFAHSMKFDIYLYDRQADTMGIVTLGLAGRKANGGSSGPALSADGRYLAFTSTASNLLAADPDTLGDIYLYDLQARGFELISVSEGGAKGTGPSSAPAVSADGRFVAFASQASNLVAGDDNSSADIFVRDRQTGSLQRFAVGAGLTCSEPTLSGDGSLLAFTATAQDGRRTLYLADRSSSQLQALGAGSAPKLSSDGRRLAYVATAPGSADVHLLDLESGRVELASISPAGEPGDGASTAVALSAHGAELAFASTSSNLVDADGNGVSDVFLFSPLDDTTPPTVELALSSTLLWPPNKKYVPVRVDGLAEDNVELASLEITVSDEYGEMTNMVVPGFGSTIWLEAWREGDDLDGRIYTITAVAIDSAGNRTEKTVTAIVPHDMRDKQK